MKKLVLFTLLSLSAVLGISAAACMGNGDAVPELRQTSSGADRSEDVITAVVPQVPHPDEALFQIGAFGDPTATLARSGGTPRPLSARLALSSFELARILALSVPARMTLPVSDAAPQTLVWLASYLEVRAGPVFV